MSLAVAPALKRAAQRQVSALRAAAMPPSRAVPAEGEHRDAAQAEIALSLEAPADSVVE
jgi:hypothetical protein